MNRASKAKEKTELASEEEKRKLAQAEALMNTEKTIYKGITIPEGFAPTKVEGEDSLDDGLVIIDGYGNEYVWVEVPKTITVYPTAGISITNFTDEEYSEIEKDLITYTSKYKNNNTECSDIWYKDEDNSDWLTEKEYYDLKKTMLKSVYQNAGFWIGRYETGIEDYDGQIREYQTEYNIKHEATQTPVIKANAYPYNWVCRTQAQKLASNMNSGSYTSSLLFGIQWDLTLKYIEEKIAEKDTSSDSREKIQTLLSSNSEEIGNYSNSELILRSGKYSIFGNIGKWYNNDSNENEDIVFNCVKKVVEERSKTILLTTGASNQTKLQNIYDMAGNVWELTLEKFHVNDIPCSTRGGAYSELSSHWYASYRSYASTKHNNSDVGFRVAMY